MNLTTPFLLFGTDTSLAMTLVLPLLAGLIIPFARRHPNLREGISITTSLLLLTSCLTLYLKFQQGDSPKWHLLEILPGLTISFEIEPLGLLFAIMSSFLWLLTSVYSIGYMRQHREKHQTRFYQFFALTMATVMGIAFSSNLFTLYVFYELLTLSTYPLVVHKGDKSARQGGRVYLAFLLSSSVLFLLFAMLQTYLLSGSLDFVPGGILNSELASPLTLAILLVLFMFGIGKGALFPLHFWLPAAMVAPTPVSALLHAVAVVKGGVFTILKVSVYLFGIDLLPTLPSTQALIYVTGFSILFASLMAMRQDNLKKRLAYSTVSQLGYISLGALLANGLGLIGSAMHMAIHGVGKITLFFCAGAILIATGKTKISEMAGLGRTMPITMAAFFIASLSVVGLPPTAGIWSKWYLMRATLETEQWLMLGLLALSSLLNLFYLVSIPLKSYFINASSRQHPSSHRDEITEAPWPMLVAIVASASACLLLFFFPQPLYDLAVDFVGPNLLPKP